MKGLFRKLLVSGTASLLLLMIIVPNNKKIRQEVGTLFEPLRGTVPHIIPGSLNFSAILILTYMRSGSSLLGEIMQQHPDSFYVFEPLHMLTESFRFKFPIQFLNGTYKEYGSYSWTDIAIPTLRAWLNCDLENVFQKGLYDKLFLSFGRKTSLLYQCFLERLKIDQKENFNFTVKYCVRELQNVCLSAKYRVVKTIRTSMEQIKEIMEEIPQLKILHLVRDPRDTLMSQKKRRMCGKGTLLDLENCTAKYCSKLNDDIKKKEINTVFRNRVKTVFFEDLVFRATEACAEMYRFSGMEFSQEVRDFVHKVTTNMSNDGCLICRENWQVGESPNNATSHVEKWRENMMPAFRKIVDNFCKESILYLNYSFANEPPN